MKVLVAHVIVTAYGFWLPNDPRGSWSDFVGAWELLRFGRATKVTTRESVAHVTHDRALRRQAKQSLKYLPVRFNGTQARAIGRGFGKAVEEGRYAVHACAILHDHAHLVIGKHMRPYERIVRHLKRRATQELRAEGIHPIARYEKHDGSLPTPWAGGLWKVYCFDPKHVRDAISYVERNPLREGFRSQRWRFVSPYAF
jgi:REP element-mobilizing transposase RayT